MKKRSSQPPVTRWLGEPLLTRSSIIYSAELLFRLLLPAPLRDCLHGERDRTDCDKGGGSEGGCPD